MHSVLPYLILVSQQDDLKQDSNFCRQATMSLKIVPYEIQRLSFAVSWKTATVEMQFTVSIAKLQSTGPHRESKSVVDQGQPGGELWKQE